MTSTDREPARREFWRGRSKARYRCPGCGRRRNEVVAMDVHHRDGNPKNNDDRNLVALCRRCHLGDQHERRVDQDALDPPTPTTTGPRSPRDLTL